MLASKPEDVIPKGVIINCASIGSFIVLGGDNFAYTTAKHAICGLTKSMASAYGIKGIRTNVVAPGYIVTGMSKDFDEQGRDYLISRTPLGRAGQPEEVAAVIASLCSPASSFVNGAIVAIDGGFLVR